MGDIPVNEKGGVPPPFVLKTSNSALPTKKVPVVFVADIKWLTFAPASNE